MKSQRDESEKKEIRFSFILGGIALLGLAFWAQLFGRLLSVEIQSPSTSVFIILAYLLPIALIFIGAMTRSKFVLLPGFLCSLIPGVLSFPNGTDILGTPESAFRLGITSIIYILAVGYVFSNKDSPRKSSVPIQRDTQNIEINIWPRIIIAMFFLGALLFRIHGDPRIQQTIIASYKDAAIGSITISIFIFFIWTVSTYLFLIIPSLNYEYNITEWKHAIFRSMRGEAFEPQRWNASHYRRNAFPALFIFIVLTLALFL